MLQLERSLEIPSFLELGVAVPVAERLLADGITSPLPIQAATIPDALAGRDVCGRAPTGSGKTLAFSIPLVAAATGAQPRKPHALVLVPTRELADQVRAVVSMLLGRGDRVATVYGGTGYEGQRKALRRGVDIVVACPGRLEDLVERGDVVLSQVSLVVLDEADRMVDMGFLKPVQRLVDRTADDRQVLLFSATIGSEVKGIINRYQRDPVRHDVEADPDDAGDVTHLFWRVARGDRVGVTAQLVREHGQTFVFCRTKHGADRTARQLKAQGVEAVAIHGDRTQGQRTRALAAFTTGRAQALVATDVVARGIHVDDVPCVVHFDPATEVTDYVHRSGRTGRAGATGTVVSLVPDEVRNDARAVQRKLGLGTELGAPDPAGSRRAQPKQMEQRREHTARRTSSPSARPGPQPRTAGASPGRDAAPRGAHR